MSSVIYEFEPSGCNMMCRKASWWRIVVGSKA